MRSAATVATAALVLALAGCGDDPVVSGPDTAPVRAPAATTPTTRAPAARPTTRRPAARGAAVKIAPSQFGRVVADRRGEALYLFDKEKSKRTECYGDCGKAWPPLLTKGTPRAAGDARAGLLGTTRRRDGKLQVT